MKWAVAMQHRPDNPLRLASAISRASAEVVLRRRLSLDYVLEHPHAAWLPTEDEKEADQRQPLGFAAGPAGPHFIPARPRQEKHPCSTIPA